MRLDHLLSKEYKPEYGLNSGQQGPFALFDFEDAENSNCTIKNGGVAQLGEHLPCTQRVRSSILLISTKHGRIAQVVRAHA